MAFVQLIAKTQRLKKYKNNLINEKKEAIEYRSTGKRRFKYKWVWIKFRSKFRKIKNQFGYCFCGKKFCFNLKHDGSIEHYVFKSVIGFFSGLLLTYLFFMIFVFQLNIRISTATVICSFLGCILVNGLAFSSKIRCIVLLTLPHFFGERGRQLLVAYALVLVISGPAQNILNNLGILSESLSCGQEQLKSVIRQIIDAIKKPFYAIKDAIKKVIATVKKVIKAIKEILIKIKRIIMAIIRVIKAAFMFLAKILNICNKELGTPFERCSRVFDNAVADCNAKLGAMFSWMCSITYIVKSVCYLVKIFDFVCMIVDFIKNSIIGVVVRKIKGFIRHIRTMFYVRIRFSHSFHFETTASKTVSEISKEILDEIKDRVKTFSAMFQFMLSTASLFVIFMIIRVVIYRYQFLTNDSFDNKYITEDFFKIDIRRAKHNRETVLPLNQREAKIYVKIKSTNLTDVERKKLRKAVMNLISVNIKAGIYMAVDYALFWILNLIKYYARFQSKVEAPNIPMPYISGKGLLADLLGSIVKAFQPLGLSLDIDTVPCLPTPIPPDYDRYLQILTLLILCWVLTLLEPYGLRFRQYIMCYYHPLRGKQRAIWLYNKILRKRSSFLKFARRQLRRKIFGSKDVEKVTLREFLVAHFRLFAFFFDKKQINCLLCGKTFRDDDVEKPIKCKTPGCDGVYCEQCFADLRNLCTVCLSPIEYGDISDLSEERDSSEDAVPQLIKPKRKKKKKYKNILSRFCKKRSKNIFQYSSTEEIESDVETSNLLTKKYEHTSTADSGKETTDSSKYSYSYQYSKDEYKLEPTKVASKDIEKQQIYDYASMDSFRDDLNEEEIKMNYRDDEKYDKNTETNENFINNDVKGKFVDNKSTQVSLLHTIKTNAFTEIIRCPHIDKVDAETVISGEAFSRIKKERHIDFLDEQQSNKTKRKLRKKRKRKHRTVLISCTDSDEDGLEYWEKTSMVTSPTCTDTRAVKNEQDVECKCVHVCKTFHSLQEEENNTDSHTYSSSSELLTLIPSKVHSKQDSDREITDVRKKRVSKLKMFLRKIIPKYKIQKEE